MLAVSRVLLLAAWHVLTSAAQGDTIEGGVGDKSAAGPLLRGAAGRVQRSASSVFDVENTTNASGANESNESGNASVTVAPTAPPTPPPPTAPPTPPPPVAVSTFFWNVHWQCSVAARGASGTCKPRAMQRFVDLALGSGADVVASVELSHGMSQPVDLVPGWAQVNGPCARGYGGDSVALAFKPGWVVQNSGGGCLRHDYDTRAFAVALVTPPVAVQGCPNLCVVAIHAPHSSITKGGDVVASVCGAAAENCAFAMGDWNVAAEHVGRLWAPLIGGTPPGLTFPNERTCCYPEWQHYGVFDHIATNVGGAATGGHTVHEYQILEENPVQEHRPVSAVLMLPAAR